jgi:hypothetical protein
MPSLRRTVSSPSVRASPYPSALSAANSSYINGASALRRGPRRTASDSYRRRVLADIEWWRVLDGQHVEEQESGLVQDQAHDPQQPGLEETESLAGDGEQAQLLRPSAPVDQTASYTITSEVRLFSSVAYHCISLNYPAQTLSIVSPFAELSISPMTLSTPSRSRHQRDSSASSTESSPEPSPVPRSMDRGLLLSVALEEAFNSHRPSAPLCPMRSVSFDYISSHQGPTEERFGDIVCL